LFAGALGVEYLFVSRYFREQALAQSNYTAAFYCQLALSVIADAESESPAESPHPPVFDYVRPFLQDSLRQSVTVYASRVRKWPRCYHLQDVNLIAKVLQGYLDRQPGSDPETEETVLALQSALGAWSRAHPQEAPNLRYRIE
jgi:hypothetical protein